MKIDLKFIGALLALFVALPATAFAHNIGGNGIESGLTHPLLGLDHLLAMVAVGVISSQIGGKAIWKVPATFVACMILGLFLTGLPFVEVAIALSVVVLGLAIVLSGRIQLKWILGCVAFFALFHGQAHGAEMPAIANATLYTLGFIISTSLLHITGVAIGHFATKTNFTNTMLKFAGVSISLMGLFFLV